MHYCERQRVAAYRQGLAQLIALKPPTLDTAFPEIGWRTVRHGSRSTIIGIMVEADIQLDLKGLIEAIDKTGIPDQLYGYISTLAGQAATMVPSTAVTPELRKMIEAEMQKHRARIAGSQAVAKAAKEKMGAFAQEMDFLKAFQAAHDTPIADQDEE